MAVQTALTIFRGMNITFTASATTPTNITGWNVQFTVRNRFGLPIIMMDTTGAGITVVDVNNGVWSINLTNAQTLQAPSSVVGNYVWDFERTDAGFEDTLGYGTLTILESYRQ